MNDLMHLYDIVLECIYVLYAFYIIPFMVVICICVMDNAFAVKCDVPL